MTVGVLPRILRVLRPMMYPICTLTRQHAEHMPNRTVFFVSDGTGITAETFGNSIMAQFPAKHRHIRRPFIDTQEKAEHVVKEINQLALQEDCEHWGYHHNGHHGKDTAAGKASRRTQAPR